MTDGGVIRLPELSEAAALVAAVEEGSLAGAGERLGISQPAMSKRIRALEALVGTVLLERDTRGVRPTPAGLRLYDDAARFLAEGERFGRAATAVRGAGTPLRVAAIFTLAESVVPGWLAAYRAGGGSGPIEVRVGHPDQVRRWVQTGESDLGFAAIWPVGRDPRGQLGDNRTLGLREEPFAEDELVAVVPEGHPWARAGRVEAAELAAAPVIAREPGSGVRELLEDSLALAGLPALRPAMTLASTPAIRAAVREQGLPAVLSRMSVEGVEGLAAVPVEGLELARTLTVLRRTRARPSAAARAFMAAAGASAGGT
jgi:DNA-binding transcriptional LysR family regulator